MANLLIYQLFVNDGIYNKKNEANFTLHDQVHQDWETLELCKNVLVFFIRNFAVIKRNHYQKRNKPKTKKKKKKENRLEHFDR